MPISQTFNSSIIKRDGREEQFDLSKIRNAIAKANFAVDSLYQISEDNIISVTEDVRADMIKYNRQFNVEEIQDLVESKIAKLSWPLAKAFTIYRYEHSKIRENGNVESDAIRDAKQAARYRALMERAWNIYECTSEDVHQENANKNAFLLSTQADYSTCEIDKEILEYKEIFSEDVLKANAEKIIKIHDMGYSGRRMYNCSLINLLDMFLRGTVLNGVLIETPKSFVTACTVATQVESHVASSQYGGQTVNLWHIARFVSVTREKMYKETKARWDEEEIIYTEAQLKADVQKQLIRHIKDGIQLLQYQTLTHMTTNG